MRTKPIIKLYEFALSGNCHKVRMLLSMLGLPYETVAVNLTEGEQRTPGYLALNPFGQVPALVDGEVVLRDSQAILVYLASRYGGVRWWPREASRQAGIVAWLSTAANEIAAGPNRLRLHHKWGRPIDLAEAEEITRKTLEIIDATLTDHRWLDGAEPGIADLALYPYVALSPEGGVDLARYPSILRWMGEIRGLDGYVSMPGMGD